jgi:hypothetical protein
VTGGDTRTPQQAGVDERIHLIAHMIYSFSDAAFRSREAPLEMARFTAELRMNTLAGAMVTLLLLETDEIDPILLDKGLHEEAKATCTPYSPERIAARLSREVADAYNLDHELESAA